MAWEREKDSRYGHGEGKGESGKYVEMCWGVGG